jgi:hypothetical protein
MAMWVTFAQDAMTEAGAVLALIDALVTAHRGRADALEAKADRVEGSAPQHGRSATMQIPGTLTGH